MLSQPASNQVSTDSSSLVSSPAAGTSALVATSRRWLEAAIVTLVLGTVATGQVPTPASQTAGEPIRSERRFVQSTSEQTTRPSWVMAFGIDLGDRGLGGSLGDREKPPMGSR